MGTHKAHAAPTKDFFVRMITKDISIEDCILDLIDNCLDGARKAKHAANPNHTVASYDGFRASVKFNGQGFTITDNCGGISISEAIDYAFHFGRRSNAPAEGDYSIGLYGIGMKRAMFKIGNSIEIYSSTDSEAFRTIIDVPEWLKREPIPVPGRAPYEDWDFDMADAAIASEPGTRIDINQLHLPIATQFSNPAFENTLRRIVARDYAQFLSKGFEITINAERVLGFPFTVRQGTEFKPIRIKYMDETGVEVEIIAGMAGAPPDDLQPTERRPETDYFGWSVICNDRVVVASNKGDQTVWGNGDFQSWHYQYNGFIGVVSFSAKDPNLLPWRTTKRDVDTSNTTYRRAVEKMKDATRSWIKYTNDRKVDMVAAKEREASAAGIPLFSVQPNPTLVVPRVVAAQIFFSSIQYSKPTSEIAEVKRKLGNPSMPNSKVGEHTFDYYVKHESED